MKPSVMLDAGHGGKDSGAVGPGGLKEKTVALAVVMLLGAQLLEAGVDVSYTRKDDTFVELAERARLGNEKGVDLFVSIHCNDSDKPASGFEVYTTPGKTKSDDAATECFMSFGDEFPTARRRMDSSDGDVDKEANFAVLRLSRGAALLFELEFINTPEGEAFLSDAANQLRMARAIARGIVRFLFPLRTVEPAGSLATKAADLAAAVPSTPPPTGLRSVKGELRRIVTELNTLAERA